MASEKNILVTRGAGFLGTHCALQLLQRGFKVVLIDNLQNSAREVVERVKDLAEPELSKNLEFHMGDLRNKEDLEKLFSSQKYDTVIYFGALKAVAESVQYPFRYFNNNLIGIIILYQTMAKYNCKKVRDYIHVMDLADGHICALKKLFTTENIGCIAYNLGNGEGTSVLEMVAAFEKASGKKIPVKFCPRRVGDATAVYAATDKAKKELGWTPKYGIEDICVHQWNWAKNHPMGYHTK